jgi:hypothetical protein
VYLAPTASWHSSPGLQIADWSNGQSFWFWRQKIPLIVQRHPLSCCCLIGGHLACGQSLPASLKEYHCQASSVRLLSQCQATELLIASCLVGPAFKQYNTTSCNMLAVQLLSISFQRLFAHVKVHEMLAVYCRTESSVVRLLNLCLPVNRKMFISSRFDYGSSVG